MIPKVIHYCWFGRGPLPDLAKKCINSWKKYCPDYEIVEWNEDNYDINKNQYMKEAYEAKKWAFVSDYARLDIIYSYGGIYLDLDVELLKPLDDLLCLSGFFGTEQTGYINTGIGFGSEKSNKLVQMMLEEYSNISFAFGEQIYDLTPCPKRNTLSINKLGFKYSAKKLWKYENNIVFPPRFFCPINYETNEITITEDTYSIHLFNASWLTNDEQEMYAKIEKIKKNHGRIISIVLIQKIKYDYECKHNDDITLLSFFMNGLKRKVIKIIKKCC